MATIEELLVLPDLPQSHQYINASINNRIIPGIVWPEQEVISDQGQLLLYKDWSAVHFASPWYEIEAEPEIDETATQRDITILGQILGEKFIPPATIIDVHCGSGRHAIDLAKKGFSVIGMEEIDLPLKIAQASAKEQNIPATFVLSNTKQHTKYASTADIVISMFNSLGYTFSQKDDQEQFHWIMQLLKPGGYFVLDIRSQAYQKKAYRLPVREKETLSIENKDVATMYTTKFWQNNILGAIEKITIGDRILQQTTYGWNTYAPDVLGAMLQQAGANIKMIHEDYYGNPNDIGERIFVVAQKK